MFNEVEWLHGNERVFMESCIALDGSRDEVSGKFQFSWPLYKDGLRVLEGK
jgi:hypothetical protein